jgi:hypothetical protein
MSSPPLEYLLTSSQSGLENFGLGRMNKIANLRHEIHDVVEEWIEAETQYRLARWILECRRSQDAASGARTTENSLPISVEEIAANLLLPSDQQPDSQERRSQPASVKLISDRSAPARGDSPAACRLSPPLRPRPSARAEDALNFLEEHIRLQLDAIGLGVCKRSAETDRAGSSPDYTRYAVQNRLHEVPHTAPLSTAAPGCFEVSESACAQTRHCASDKSTKRTAPNRPAPAESASKGVQAQIVPLVRGGKARPSPIRAAMHYTTPQRRAV